MLRRSEQIGALLVQLVITLGCSSGEADMGGSGGIDISVGYGGGTSTDASGEGGYGATTDTLGKRCDSDSSCGGLTCITASAADPVFGGGVAGGYCTEDCVSHTDCPTGGLCVTTADGTKGHCIRSCTIGAPTITSVWDPLDPTKCFGRNDLRCVELDSGQGACAPSCGSNEDCPGRVCDPWLAVCVDSPHPGSAIGDKCDPTASQCAGVCLQFDADQTMCSSPCSLGGETLDTHDCGGLANGLCVFSPQKNGLGDGGYCTPSCALHADCQNPLLWCFSFAGPPPTSTPLAQGYCLRATSCPGGDGDCSGTGLPCVTTSYGPYCIDPARLSTTSGAGGSTP